MTGTYSREQRALPDRARRAGGGGAELAAGDAHPGRQGQLDRCGRARGLAALGLIESAAATFDPPWTVDCVLTPRACQQVSLWAIHGITHGLGLEVHDPIQAFFGD